MNEQIYTLLNEIDNQPDSYEIPQVSDLEMKKWKKQFSSRRVFRRSRKKYVAAAAIVCILGGSLLFPPAQFIAYAGMKTVTYNLSGNSEGFVPLPYHGRKIHKQRRIYGYSQ